jgi:hypothetical protein
MTTRHLRAVPKEGESINDHIMRENYEKSLRVVSGFIEETHEIAACRRTLKRLLSRANRCGAEDRAAYLETSLESLEEARYAK